MIPYEIPRGCVIVGGKSYPCASEVRGVADHGMEFTPGGPGARPRKLSPQFIALHYTADELAAPALFRALLDRKNRDGKPMPLGIEFAVDRDGVIWQFCDPGAVDTFDLGEYNRVSVGIEITSCGRAPLKGKGIDRGTYVDTIGGERITFASFYLRQSKAVLDLVDTLVDAFELPRVVATDKRLLTPAEIASFRGVLGHYHVSADKRDPGTQILSDLVGHGYKERAA